MSSEPLEPNQDVIIPRSRDSLGRPVYKAQLTRTDNQSEKVALVRQTAPLPVIFIPGIMGTNLLTEHRPSTEEVTFVLSEKWLITVRYADLRSFREFENRCIRQLDANRSSTQLFALMMDSLVDRIADVLEAVQGQLSSMSREIFAESTAQTRKPKTDLQQIIKHLGRSSSLLSKLNDSLLSINRMNSYFRQGCNGWLSEPAKVLAKTVERDVRSLDEYLAKMSTEINFLLDATLGLINIEQNSIIKVFSIAAVLFLPPTLVGTVYGMNFKDMPELDWSIGYPMALGMMVVSAILPYLWFKFKNWL